MKVKRIRKLEQVSFTTGCMNFVRNQLEGIAQLTVHGDTLVAVLVNGMDAAFARTIRFLTNQDLIKIQEPALQRFFYRR